MVLHLFLPKFGGEEEAKAIAPLLLSSSDGHDLVVLFSLSSFLYSAINSFSPKIRVSEGFFDYANEESFFNVNMVLEVSIPGFN